MTATSTEPTAKPFCYECRYWADEWVLDLPVSRECLHEKQKKADGSFITGAWFGCEWWEPMRSTDGD